METSRGRQCLVHDGYTFRPGYTLTDSSVRWRCTRKTCKATVTTTPEGQIVQAKGQHDHAYDRRKLARVAFRSRCKRKAIEDVRVNPTVLMRSEMAAMPSYASALELKDLRNVRQSLYRIRRQAWPTSGADAAEMDERLGEADFASGNYLLDEAPYVESEASSSGAGLSHVQVRAVSNEEHSEVMFTKTEHCDESSYQSEGPMSARDEYHLTPRTSVTFTSALQSDPLSSAAGSVRTSPTANFSNDLLVKAYLGASEIRRFLIDGTKCNDFLFVKHKVHAAFSIPGTQRITIGWKDDEDELITVSTDEELADAVSCVREPPLKLYISRPQSLGVVDDVGVILQRSSRHVEGKFPEDGDEQRRELPSIEHPQSSRQTPAAEESPESSSPVLAALEEVSKLSSRLEWRVMTTQQRQSILNQLSHLLNTILSAGGVNVTLAENGSHRPDTQITSEPDKGIKCEPYEHA